MNEYKITYDAYYGDKGTEYICARNESEARYLFDVLRPLSEIISIEWMGE